MTNLEPVLPELMALPLFAAIPQSKLLELCTGASVQVNRHREVLFSAGDAALNFGVVLNGAYKLCRPSPMGEDVIMHFSTHGDIIAAGVMSKPGAAYPVSAISMGASRFLKIPKAQFLEAWTKDHELMLRVQSYISTRMVALQDQKIMGRAPLNQKIAALLMNLLEKNHGEEALTLPLPLTRKEIADTLGASVESVIRVMSEWSKLGLIQTTDQNIKVLRLAKIIEILKNG